MWDELDALGDIRAPFTDMTIRTPVTVPNGRTISIGGLKQTADPQVDRGIPFLNKIPYINRLFKNVGIGRETESLQVLVTPRIIINAE